MGMDVYGKTENSYFRANIWSWRVINHICFELNKQDNLKLDLTSWSSNDGAGLSNQADCDKLANALQSFIDENDEKKYFLESDCRVDDKGRFLGDNDDKTYSKSAYSTDKEHLLQFIEFLRGCGGSFEIC